MSKKLAKQLLEDFGLTEGEDSGLEADVLGRLNRSVKMDEIDTITFGLETDDGKIVKVYVKADQADDFEKELSTKLGEIDDIEEVLNMMAKDYEIVDVEWPEEEKKEEKGEEDEDEEDGSNSMNKKVYQNPIEKSKETHQVKQEESLNFGEKFIMGRLSESDVDSTVEARLSTATQLMIYQAILDLGIPEIALNRSPYKISIINGIKQRGLEIANDTGIKTALKMFIHKMIDYTKKAEENKMKNERDEVKESYVAKLMEKSIVQDYWETVIKIMRYVSQGEAVDQLVNGQAFKALMSKSSSALGSSYDSELRQVLDKLADTIEVGNVTLPESTTPTAFSEFLVNLLTIADSTPNASMVASLLKSAEYAKFISDARESISGKFNGSASSAFNAAAQALSNITKQRASQDTSSTA